MKVTVIEIKHHLKNKINKIKPYLKDMIHDLKKSDTWKSQLTIAINFISSKYNDEERVIHSKTDNIKFMIYDKADKVIEELFQSLLSRYHIRLETSMRGSDFICILLLIYCITNAMKYIQIVVDHI